MGQIGRRWAMVVGLAILAVASGSGWRWWEVRQDRDEFRRIEVAIREGLYALAARDLADYLRRRPESDRAAYLLGTCEKAAGHAREAEAAWSRVPPDSPMNGQAVASRMDLLLEQGRLADAEALVERASAARGTGGIALRMLLLPTLIQEGRRREATQIVEARWHELAARGEAATDQAINLGRLHMELRWNLPPVEAVQAYLDEVGRLAPNDDRIRLARANLAIRLGAWDDADRNLAECLRRRPEDPAVHQSRLEWATHTDHPAEARDALKHLPPGWLSLAECHGLSAWFASKCGDTDRERREIDAMLAESPEDFEAMKRLQGLDRGSSNRSPADWRRLRTEVERDQARYRELHRRNQPARNAEEIARLAVRLGHPFEAIVYLTAAIAEEPEQAQLRLSLRSLEQTQRHNVEEAQGAVARITTDCRGAGAPSAAKPAPYYGGKKVGQAFQPVPLEKVRPESLAYLSFFFASVVKGRFSGGINKMASGPRKSPRIPRSPTRLEILPGHERRGGSRLLPTLRLTLALK